MLKLTNYESFSKSILNLTKTYKRRDDKERINQISFLQDIVKLINLNPNLDKSKKIAILFGACIYILIEIDNNKSIFSQTGGTLYDLLLNCIQMSREEFSEEAPYTNKLKCQALEILLAFLKSLKYENISNDIAITKVDKIIKKFKAKKADKKIDLINLLNNRQAFLKELSLFSRGKLKHVTQQEKYDFKVNHFMESMSAEIFSKFLTQCSALRHDYLAKKGYVVKTSMGNIEKPSSSTNYERLISLTYIKFIAEQDIFTFTDPKKTKANPKVRNKDIRNEAQLAKWKSFLLGAVLLAYIKIIRENSYNSIAASLISALPGFAKFYIEAITYAPDEINTLLDQAKKIITENPKFTQMIWEKESIRLEDKITNIKESIEQCKAFVTQQHQQVNGKNQLYLKAK